MSFHAIAGFKNINSTFQLPFSNAEAERPYICKHVYVVVGLVDIYAWYLLPTAYVEVPFKSINE